MYILCCVFYTLCVCRCIAIRCDVCPLSWAREKRERKKKLREFVGEKNPPQKKRHLDVALFCHVNRRPWRIIRFRLLIGTFRRRVTRTSCVQKGRNQRSGLVTCFMRENTGKDVFRWDFRPTAEITLAKTTPQLKCPIMISWAVNACSVHIWLSYTRGACELLGDGEFFFRSNEVFAKNVKKIR